MYTCYEYVNNRAKVTVFNSNLTTFAQYIIKISMANSYFQFKQFTIRHDLCAMKVGTDGVLLGAWADVRCCRKILDIGTGTGLIALMLAQRCTAGADAIDIDTDACNQAVKNVADSPFAGRIRVIQADFASYAAGCTDKYDLIVSNPPYFIDSLKCPDGKRNLARHTDTLLLADLIKGSGKLLTTNGRIALILPFEQLHILLTIAKENQLYPCRRTDVLPLPGALPKRLLIELSLQQQIPPPSDTLVIEEARHQYTEAYTALTKDFYLKM